MIALRIAYIRRVAPSILNGGMGADNREYPRYALEAALTVEHGRQRVEGRSRNLSRGGLCATLSAPVPVGELITVRLALLFDEGSTSEPLDVSARAVWCTPIGSSHQVGLQFAALSDEQRTYLGMFLRFLEEGRQSAPGPASGDGDPFSS